MLYVTGLRLGADCFTTILDLHAYLDNGVPNYHQMRYGDSPYPYFGLCEGRDNKYNTICLFLVFFVRISLLIIPQTLMPQLIIPQTLMPFRYYLYLCVDRNMGMGYPHTTFGDNWVRHYQDMRV